MSNRSLPPDGAAYEHKSVSWSGVSSGKPVILPTLDPPAWWIYRGRTYGHDAPDWVLVEFPYADSERGEVLP